MALPHGSAIRAAVCLAALVWAPPAAADVLRVGTSGDYAPFSLDGGGFDLEVARRLASDWGMELRLVPFVWPALSARLADDEFDVVMSGVTWTPERAVVGWMSRALAAGGPCLLLARAEPTRIGVNRGGFLERWARSQFAAVRLVTVGDNRSLPSLLERGEVDAIVTDSFELRDFQRPGLVVRCAPPGYRKVYWLAPARAEAWGPRLDAWLAAREDWLQELRLRHFGARAPRSEADHLLDLVARRLAFMPYVAAYKRERDLPIEDPEREARVLASALEGARAAGADPTRVEAFFRLQIELAKAVQERSTGGAGLDLARQIRPVLLRLGTRITAALAAGATLARADSAALDGLLEPEEVRALAGVLDACHDCARGPPSLEEKR